MVGEAPDSTEKYVPTAPPQQLYKTKKYYKCSIFVISHNFERCFSFNFFGKGPLNN